MTSPSENVQVVGLQQLDDKQWNILWFNIKGTEAYNLLIGPRSVTRFKPDVVGHFGWRHVVNKGCTKSFMAIETWQET